MHKRDLPPKRQRFVDEYLVDMNGAAAAIRAGYSARTAQVQASQLLSNLMVAEAVARAQAERSARLGLTADRVLEELSALAFAKLGDYVDWDAEHFALRPSAEIDSRALLTVKITRRVVGRKGEDDDAGEEIIAEERSVRIFDKLGPLKLLGQHLGMFKEQVDDLRSEAERIAREHNLPPEQAGKIVSLAERLKRGRTGS